ncbi:MAG: hypothetical protein KDI73_09370 [Candidatus Competibacteraceae bacterium]|nr:hypothetical protein [Candidatus Competibacteraceae bacterium]
MTNSQCCIIFSHGEAAGSVADGVRQWVADVEPLLAWAEPDPLHVDIANRTGRRDDFKPLVIGMPSWPTDTPLLEARLFWATSALYIVARENGGWSWARIEEAAENSGGAKVACSVIPVHTLRDVGRFGVPDGPAIKGLQAIEYREQGRLVAWRLVIES